MEAPNMESPALQPKTNRPLWQKIITALGTNQRFFWTTFWLLIAFIILLLPLFYANLTGKIYLAPAFLWAFAFLMVGIVTGFIFGVPTIITSGPSAADTQQQALKDNKKAEKIVQANTNLTQISDWLTKVIVGAGLVELSKIPGFIESVSKKMAKGMMVPGVVNNEAFAAVFSGAIIVLFLSYGFVCGYLVMRIVLTEIFSD
ncbi:hypothetical protein PV783_22245 [Chitinophaga sp. CC14]|uniref:hypothetical protein n=1 Tax=Chitinophaga sp. CC14 TaxID=3029199 RepID=UPI003B7B6170